jgi:hypothetical protein
VFPTETSERSTLQSVKFQKTVIKGKKNLCDRIVSAMRAAPSNDSSLVKKLQVPQCYIDISIPQEWNILVSTVRFSVASNTVV